VFVLFSFRCLSYWSQGLGHPGVGEAPAAGDVRLVSVLLSLTTSVSFASKIPGR